MLVILKLFGFRIFHTLKIYRGPPKFLFKWDICIDITVLEIKTENIKIYLFITFHSNNCSGHPKEAGWSQQWAGCLGGDYHQGSFFSCFVLLTGSTACYQACILCCLVTGSRVLFAVRLPDGELVLWTVLLCAAFAVSYHAYYRYNQWKLEVSITSV